MAEDKLEAYAILTAMGPTYFWFQWQELLQIGLSFGLDALEIETGLAEDDKRGSQHLVRIRAFSRNGYGPCSGSATIGR